MFLNIDGNTLINMDNVFSIEVGKNDEAALYFYDCAGGYAKIDFDTQKRAQWTLETIIWKLSREELIVKINTGKGEMRHDT